MRGGKSTVFIPYVYLPGFRVLEKLSSKGVPVIDGESVLRAEMDKRGEGARTALALTRGQVDGQNEIRFKSALSELQRREEMGADVSVADYIDATYIERMPCYSVNHPAPHTEYDIGRATLPAGTGGLSPYCVDALGLKYGPDTHWFSQTNRLAREVAKKWEAERQ